MGMIGPMLSWRTRNQDNAKEFVMIDFRQAIREYIIKECNPGMPVEYGSPLVEQGIIDSLAIFMLIGFIKEEFGIEIDPDDVSLDNFETIDAIEQLVLSARSSAHGGAARDR
jgi:acyl carrier protein